MKKLLLLLAVLCSGVLWASADTVTVAQSDFTSANSQKSYVTSYFEVAVSGNKFQAKQINPSTGQIKVNANGASGFNFYNTTALPGISKIVMTTDASTQGTYYVATGDSEISSSVTASTSGAVKGTNSGKTTTFVLTSQQSYFHFNLTSNGSGTVKLTSIVITYEGGVLELGNISGSYGEGDDAVAIESDKSYEIEQYTSLNFAAENATAITVKVGDGDDAPTSTFDSNTATWTPDPMDETPVTVTATRGDQSSSLSFKLKVNKSEYSYANWYTTGIGSTSQGNKDAGTIITLSLSDDSDAGTWTVTSPNKYYIGVNGNSVQLGSGTNPFKSGTITLSDSELKANAEITEISVTGYTAESNSLTVTIDGQTAGTITMPTASATTTLNGFNLVGNKIVLTSASNPSKAMYLGGITIKYKEVEVAAPGEVAMTADQEVTNDSDILTLIEGTKLTFTSEGATYMAVRNQDGDAPVVIVEAYGPEVSWTPTIDDNELTFDVIASNAGGEATYSLTLLDIQAKKVEMGEIKVVYGDDATEVGEDPVVVDEQTEFTISCENARSFDVQVGEADAETLTGEKVTWTPAITAATTVTITARRDDNEPKVFSFNLTVNEFEKDTYVLVTDASQLVSGAQYLIANPANTKILGAYNSYNFFATDEFTLNDNEITIVRKNTNINVVTLEQQTDVDDQPWMIKTSLEGKYMSAGSTRSSNVYLNAKGSNYETQGYVYSIEPNAAGEVSIQFNFTDEGAYNNFGFGTTYFANYTSTKSVKLYKIASATDDETPTVDETGDIVFTFSSEDNEETMFEKDNFMISTDDGVGVAMDGSGAYVLYSSTSSPLLVIGDREVRGISAVNVETCSSTYSTTTYEGLSDDSAADIVDGDENATGTFAVDEKGNASWNAADGSLASQVEFVPTNSNVSITKVQITWGYVTPVMMNVQDTESALSFSVKDGHKVLYAISGGASSTEGGAGAPARVVATSEMTEASNGVDGWTIEDKEYTFDKSQLSNNQSISVTVQNGPNYSATQEYNLNPAGIEAVAADSVAGEAVYYNLQGQRVANPAAGLYIRVQGNRAEKVVLK